MQLYNSLSRKKELFTPRNGTNVSMYVCGITPYDTTHLGHAFTYLSFDLLIRYLTYKKMTVKYVQNVTDIDDDILKKAKEVGKDWRILGNYWTDRFVSDLKALNVRMPDKYVKATDSIEKIVSIVADLLEKKFAYIVDGNIYFAHKKYKEYGQLSRLSEKQMLVIAKERGGRVDDPKINDPLDFLLWQKSLKGEPFWNSPWGKGRPGWHIECSAMVHEYLGEQIDIHGGGADLMYPHHESEIAQSESYTGKNPFAKYWMHTAMLLYEGEKMSKSLGNLVMVRDLLKKYSPNAIRWVLLSHHYRKPWEFMNEEIEIAEETVTMLTKIGKQRSGNINKTLLQEFEKELEDDLQSNNALKIIEKAAKQKERRTVRELLQICGFIL